MDQLKEWCIAQEDPRLKPAVFKNRKAAVEKGWPEEKLTDVIEKRKIERDIPATNEIKMFFHCTKCLENKPAGVSPQEWVRLEAGWTPLGFQVWCVRHGVNIIHVDFQGQKHPANTRRLPDEHDSHRPV